MPQNKEDVAQEIYTYARNIVTGKHLANQYVIDAAQRFLNDLSKSKKKNYPYTFNEAKAWRIIYFLEHLPHIKGKWARRKELMILGAWQKFIVGQIFGWVHKKTGLRRFKTVYIEVPRKNGKSCLSAGVAIYMLGMDGEAGSEVYSAATKRDQARIVFDDSCAMVRKTPLLSKRYGIDAKAHTIVQIMSGSKYMPLASDSSGLEGLHIHCGVIDELHAHKSRAVYDVIETATGARDQPLIWNITTAGSNKTGVCYELRNYVTKVLGGFIEDDSFFGIIYAMDDDDDWLDPKIWEKANPNFGVSVSIEDLERKAKKASTTPAAQGNFLTKHLNRWINADSPWMDMIAWDLCKDETLKMDDFKDCPCWVGLDLANRVDPAALVLVFQKEEKLITFQKFYMPEDTIYAKAVTVGSHYVGWAKENYIHAIPGPVIDQDTIELDILEINEHYDVREVVFDPWQAQQLIRNCHNAGVNTIELRPGVKSFSEPMKHLEGIIKQRRIVHNDNPCMTWMMSNVVAHINAKDEIYPNKPENSSKIDGVIGLLMCINRILADEGPLPIPTISVY